MVNVPTDLLMHVFCPHWGDNEQHKTMYTYFVYRFSWLIVGDIIILISLRSLRDFITIYLFIWYGQSELTIYITFK